MLKFEQNFLNHKIIYKIFEFYNHTPIQSWKKELIFGDKSAKNCTKFKRNYLKIMDKKTVHFVQPQYVINSIMSMTRSQCANTIKESELLCKHLIQFAFEILKFKQGENI